MYICRTCLFAIIFFSMPMFAQYVHAETRVFFGSAEFEVELTSRGSELKGMDRLSTNAETIVLANEVSSLPGANTGVGDTLTFAATSTGLSRDYILRTSEDNARFTFDDDEEDGNMVNFDDALSVGDINNSEDDDWSLTISEPIRAVGFHLYDNIFDGSETLTLHDGGTLLETIPLPSGNSVSQFIGVITDFDFTEIRFNEGAGSDDIAIANFKFPRALPDLTHANYYGNKLAMDADGQTLAVAAMGSNDAGMVLVHDRNLGGAYNWGIVAKLTAPDGADFDRFGLNLDISADGDTIVVGAPYHNTFDLRNTGAAYVYSRHQGGENNWGLVKKLVPAGEPELTDVNFGYDVGIDDAGQIIIVGSPGDNTLTQNTNYTNFLRNNGGINNWGNSGGLGGQLGDDCGRSIAISGNGKSRAMGCPLYDLDNNDGLVFIFQAGSNFTIGKVAGNMNNVGERVELNYDATVLVVKTGTYTAGVYRRDSTSASMPESPTVVLANPIEDFQLSTAGDKVIIGMPSLSSNSGGAWLYSSSNGLFLDTLEPIALSGELQEGLNFGYGVAMNADGSLVAVGAPKITRPSNESGTGEVYLFKPPELVGPEGVTRLLVNDVITPLDSFCVPIKAKNGNIALVCL